MTDKVKTFPLRLNLDLNKKIDIAVIKTDAKSKHEYILEAIKERLDRDERTIETEESAI